ncbi:MAG TPA: hypothetical protein VFI38_17605 [Candidatus Acidoferrum sp.]|nr:hypothetical protein [Candidatus Acidoferrum sp.]
MKPVAYPRRIAVLLLRFAIWMSPGDTLDWGHAMLAELDHVHGDWAALLWSLGSARVLAKQALLYLIFPSRNRSTISSGGDLLSKEGPMRKPALAITAACVIASLLFFVAPVFRQAFHVSLLQWQTILRTDYSRLSPELQLIVKKAEQDHDAEAMAFVAFHHPQSSEAARLADEAVRLDPTLTWVYVIVAVRWGSLPEIDRWIPALERFDPQNALPHLITAEKIDIEQVLGGNVRHRAEDKSPAWESTMAAAFESENLDTYSAQRKELDRRVFVRYHIGDPELIAGDAWFYSLPSYSVGDACLYGGLVLASAQDLEAKGNGKAAAEKYLAVAHFGRLLGPEGNAWFSKRTQQAYTRLAALAAKSSRPEEAVFYALLADQERQRSAQESSSRYRRFGGSQVARWDADLARRSGAVMLLSGTLLLATLFAVVLRSRALRLSLLRPGRLAIALGVSSSAAYLVSSIVLRLSYQPYSEILQHFIRDGDEADLATLRAFLDHAYAPIGSGWLNPRQDYAYFFWFAVLVLCTFGLLVSALRYFYDRPRASATI